MGKRALWSLKSLNTNVKTTVALWWTKYEKPKERPTCNIHPKLLKIWMEVWSLKYCLLQFLVSVPWTLHEKTQKLVFLPSSLRAKHRRPSYWLWSCFLALSEAWMEGFKNVSFCFWKDSCGKNSTSLWYLKTKISFIVVFQYTTARLNLLYDRIN